MALTGHPPQNAFERDGHPNRAFVQRMVPLLILCVCPFVLLALNDSWAFTAVYYGLDPWFYTGSFVHFPEHLRTFAGTYYMTRLPHLLAGAAAYQLFDPPYASYALRLLYWYVGTFSLYGSTRALGASRSAALTTSLIFGTSVYVLWAIGWDYVDGAGVVLMLAAMFFMVGRGTRTRHLLAGVLQMWAFTTYSLLIVLLPVQLIALAAMRMRDGRSPLLWQWTAIGWVAGFAVLCGVNWLATGEWNYLEPQLRAAATLSDGREAWKSGYAWLKGANWLFLPAVSCVCALILTLSAVGRGRRIRTSWKQSGVLESLQLLVGLGIFAALEQRGFWVLQLSYVAVYLMPFVALVLGVVFASCFARLSFQEAAVVGTVTLLSILMPFVPIVAGHYPRCSPWCVPWPSLAFVLLALASTIAVAAVLSKRIVVGALLAGVLGVSNMVFADLRQFEFSPSSQRRQDHSEAIRVTKLVGERFPRTRVRFWYDSSEELGDVYRSIASTYIWSFSLVGEDFPSLTGRVERDIHSSSPATNAQPDMRVADRNMQLSPGDVIVVPTARSTAAVLDAFRAHGVTPVVVGDDRLVISGKPFHVVSIRLEPVGTLVVIPLDRLQAENGVVRPMQSGSVEIITRDTPYTYAASVDLRQSMPRVRGQMTIAMQVHDVQGRIGLCVLDAKEAECLASKVLDATIDQMVYVTVKDAEQATRLIIESYDKPESGRLAVSTIGVLVQEAK
jgi:hypothetical protein